MKGMLNTEALAETMKLRKMGAKIQSVDSKMCIVKFEEAGVQIEYAYSVNSVGKYHLERIKPYPLPLREFTREDKLIEIIGVDLDQFRNAINFLDSLAPFIALSNDFHRTFQKLEDLYLYYEVQPETLEAIHNKLREIDTLIVETAKDAKRIYHRKEPDTL